MITGAIALVFVLGSSLIHYLCAPCLGLVLGLAAGYLAEVFEKPATFVESIRRGAVAEAIAGLLGFVGGLVVVVINAVSVNPADAETLYKPLGISN